MTKPNFPIISPEFYESNTVDLAKSLLGKILVFDSPKGLVAGKIVETEAYLQEDPSSHSFAGINQRNQMMFGAAGTVYIYQIYGIYHCLNISSNQKGVGEAVLIRALEPITGIEIMRQNRSQKLRQKPKLELLQKPLLNSEQNPNPTFLQTILTQKEIQNLCSGPAKLMLALGITKNFNGHLIWNQPLWIAKNLENKIDQEIVTTTRIGISKAKDLALRFYLKDNIFISKK